jgi:hypothetical protein
MDSATIITRSRIGAHAGFTGKTRGEFARGYRFNHLNFMVFSPKILAR